jgi:predicted  nucleic acid-binding Zn-ribbon protein
MIVLDYDGDQKTHVCESCEAEFSITIIDDSFDEHTVSFCPCCGSPLTLEEDDDEDYDEDE